MNCLCQRVYDTGFTGIARIDARLAHQYEVYGEDCIRRAFDHANRHIPYTDTPRRPYCFVTREQKACEHESCEHARYRPPDTVRKMRWYIEHSACKASVHYPSMLDDHTPPEVVAYGGVTYKTGGEETKYGTPDFLRRKRRVEENGQYLGTLHCLQSTHVPANDSALAEREAWEDAMHRLHKRLEAATPHRTVTYEGRKTQQLPLRAISIESFREYVAESLFDLSPLPTAEEEAALWEAAEEKLNLAYERFWNEGFGEWDDEEIQQAYAN